MSYRTKVIERDLAGFVRASSNATGAIVVRSPKGRGDIPIYCQSDNDVISYFGKGNSTYYGLFEAITYCKVAPSWIISAIGDNAYYAGIDVKTTSVETIGLRSERIPSSFVYTSAKYNTIETIGTGDGLTATFAGTLTDTPIVDGSLIFTVAGNTKTITDSGGNLSGADVSAGTITYATGSYSVTFSGSVGTVASFVGDIDINTGTTDLSSGAVDKLVNITIDGVTYEDINLGQSATTSSATIIGAINTAVGSTVASLSTNFIQIDGLIGNATTGGVTIDDPTTGTSAVDLVFWAAGGPVSEQTASTSPTGAIPANGEVVKIDYQYTQDISADVSHTIYTISPWDDDYETLGATVENLTGSQYKLTLYKVTADGNQFLTDYTYSLIREKNDFGQSIYYEDVFQDTDEYIQIVVNSSFVGTAVPADTTTVVSLLGGERGDEPTSGQFTTTWDIFQKKNRYFAKIFMDVYGNAPNKVNELVTTYQTHGFAISAVPFGNDRAAAITYRQGLGIDSDQIAFYTNWEKIEDPYNDSTAWTSAIGKQGIKLAQMVNVFDSLSPAGIDENGHGGQHQIGFKVIEREYDYTDTDVGSDLQLLDEAQINPIIFNPVYGNYAYGDRTALAKNTDTSFIGTRRLYNLIIFDVTTQILKKQEFKNNDNQHRFTAKTLTEEYLSPILAGEYLSDAEVVCDTTNNTPAVLNQRRFILDIYVKATPNSQEVLLRLTRVSQTQVIADVINSAG